MDARQAIIVKYFAPTNYYGARWKASAAAGYIWMYDPVDSSNSEERAVKAAKKLAEKFDWAGFYYGGTLKSGEYVFIQKRNSIADFVHIAVRN